MTRAVLAVLALALLLPSSAVAQAGADAETQANFDRAATYWDNAATICVTSATPTVVVDQAFVAPDAARAQQGTCKIWVGDFYLSTTPARRCAIIVHEWGHLTGHPDGMGATDDPLGVMGSDAMPSSCSALDPAPAPVATPSVAAAPALNLDNDTAYVRWATQRSRRADCRVNADMKRHRAARVAARQHCIARYGRIGRMPPLAR